MERLITEVLEDKIYQIDKFLLDDECEEYINYLNEQERSNETTRYTKEGKYYDAISDKNIYQKLENYKDY